MKVARVWRRPHTENMAVPKMRGSQHLASSCVVNDCGSLSTYVATPVLKKGRLVCLVVLAVALFGATAAARADEIRLKDGKKLYGVIVAYEDNMFKVKTDFGYVLVEKDKIASIVPSISSLRRSTLCWCQRRLRPSVFTVPAGTCFATIADSHFTRRSS